MQEKKTPSGRSWLRAAAFLAVSLSAVCAAEEPPVLAVWARPADSQTTTLHYAVKKDGAWQPSVQLAVAAGLHLTPVIAADRQGAVWIVWTERKAEESLLRYALLRGGKTETGRVIAAGPEKEQSYAPAIVIDPQDLPWIAWSGVQEGQLADVHVSHWLGSRWAEPVRANEPNETPDITPLLGLRGGSQLWLSWFGLSKDDEVYVRFTAELHDGAWQTAPQTAPAEASKAFIAQRTQIEPFPAQAEGWVTGALFAGLKHEIQSVSERFASFQIKEEKK
ncbi:MAG: hypothetical protein ACTFAL_15920 [Candidatus Electronema sp. V4]|uniref:hypothetical protein n=1 Tax=Candidatus Electronema sp. V4 TaxID=3454756 RepID=UPI0040559866